MRSNPTVAGCPLPGLGVAATAVLVAIIAFHSLVKLRSWALSPLAWLELLLSVDVGR